MFRIRRVYDYVLPFNRDAVDQVQEILRSQFRLSKREAAKLPDQLHNPLKYRFHSILFVAEGSKGLTRGFALLFHEPILGFCYLDYISTAERRMGRGIGGALYERVRDEALLLGSTGLFFECLPDDPKLCRDPALLRQNASRLRFYERYGARPIANTAYETPLKPGDDNPPYLLFDGLDQDIALQRKKAREVARAILERKYKGVCPGDYVEMVVESFKDDPVVLREPKYITKEVRTPVRRSIPTDKRVALVVNDRHAIHHVVERGYVQSPVRIPAILRELERTDLFEKVSPRQFPERHITSVHDPQYVEYFKRVCRDLEPGKSVYPYVFPIRNMARPPRQLPIRAGYYCIDTFTPLNRNAYVAARRAVDCALTAAEELVAGRRLAYALVRPPGHHAERRSFGGFCYFNSAAIAAHYLSTYGKVAIVDVDYHHGNGQQYIFYERSDVLTVSIHGHPHIAYPYFSGFEDEKGAGAGLGYNLNVALPEDVDGQAYREHLQVALNRAWRFRPRFVVVAFGLDTSSADPTGSWNLSGKDFEANGRMIGSLQIPTLVTQEGGYNTKVLGANARSFFVGLWQAAHSR